jgi:putative nucleotidyltransferase with HDIG domain
MARTTRFVTRLRMLWIASFALPALAQIGLATLWPEGGLRRSPALLFTIVIIGASLCALAAGMVIARARRTNEVELGYLGLFYLTVSVLPLVHGLTTPGVIYGENAATASAAFWSVPLAIVVASPALLRRSKLASKIDRSWKRWLLVGQTTVITIAALLLVFPDLLPSPTPDTTWVFVVAGTSAVGCIFYSVRHLHIAEIARSPAPLAVSLGYGFVGASALVWLGAAPYSTGFWVAHLLDISGVFLGTIGALVAYKRTDHIRPLIETILVVDPRSAFEIGLEPAVHKFIADLEAKDPITRDHVVRTTELAMIVGRTMGMEGDVLRELGLAALLHDIGKLLVPDTLLNKPGALEPDEYKIVQRHAAYGAEIVAESKPLASIAPAIRAHHERIDGSGYPNGLLGHQIPLAARIVAVCDAFDALSNTRQYRQGVSVESAIDVLQRHAGSQWDRRVVETVVRTVRNNPPTLMPERLDAIGRIGCDCIPTVAA